MITKKLLVAIPLLLVSAMLSANLLDKERSTDDLIPALIPLLSGDKEIVKPVRFVGDAAKKILEYTTALGPIYVTAKYVAPLPDGCAILMVNMEVRNTLTTDGRRVPFVSNIPMPLCKNGKPPVTKIDPATLAKAQEFIIRNQQIEASMRQTQQKPLIQNKPAAR